MRVYNESTANVVIPSNVKSIVGFFENENAKTVDMNTSSIMGNAVFMSSRVLATVYIRNVQTIGNSVMQFCTQLDFAYFYCNAPQSCGNGVFDDCSLDFFSYYDENTSGWTTPVWNGYLTQAFTVFAGILGDLTGDQASVADVKQDSNANTADAVTILRYSAGLLPSLQQLHTHIPKRDVASWF